MERLALEALWPADIDVVPLHALHVRHVLVLAVVVVVNGSG
jgi:hypothetical protein